MEKEKKQIKISLWTFYVLVAGIVILIGAIIIGGMNVKKKMDNLEQGQASLANKVVQEEKNETAETPDKVENVSKNDANVEEKETEQDGILEEQSKNENTKDESLKEVTLDDNDIKKCLAYFGIDFGSYYTDLNQSVLTSLYYEAKKNNNKLTSNNISNRLILSIAMNYNYYYLLNYEFKDINQKTTVSKEEITEMINKIFGKNIHYNHQNFNNGMKLGGIYPYFNEVEYNPTLNVYNVKDFRGDSDSDSFITLFNNSSKAKKSENNIEVILPIAFINIEEVNDDYSKINYYSDFETPQMEELKYDKVTYKNFITYGYEIYRSFYSIEESERYKQELTANNKFGTIEENMDKLHKIKITFTKDDSNEYHFESFEIID